MMRNPDRRLSGFSLELRRGECGLQAILKGMKTYLIELHSMMYLDSYRRHNPWWTALVIPPDNIIPETRISRPPFMIISEAVVLSSVLSSSPKQIRLRLAGQSRSIAVNPAGNYAYIAANADEIISRYIDRLAVKKTFTKAAAAKLSDFLKLTLTVEGIS